MKGKMVLGLTGGVASGKSTVLNEFLRSGVAVIDCDKIAREVVRKGTSGLARIRNVFGQGVLYKDGTLDRPALARAVFSHPGKRKALEAIIHPRVKKEVWKRVKAIRRGVVVVDVPLLFEVKWQGDFDKVLVVWVPKKSQMSRLMDRDGYSKTEAMARIRAQMPLFQKRKKAHFIIDNSGSKGLVRAQVKKFLDNLR